MRGADNPMELTESPAGARASVAHVERYDHCCLIYSYVFQDAPLMDRLLKVQCAPPKRMRT